MADLLFTTDAFEAQGRQVPGIPMLLDHEMRLIEPACSWLLHISLIRGRTRSRQTWRTYGEALYDWWQTLEANGWSWDSVRFHEVAAYRDRMLTSRSEHTGRPFARATINGRLRTIAQFYRWSVDHGLIDSAPFSSEDVSVARWRPAPALVHIDARGGIQSANALLLREHSTLPKPMPPADIRRILQGRTARDRLIIEWAALTGMRRMEIAGLERSSISGSQTRDAGGSQIVPVRLTTTKGDRSRLVYPPLRLVDRTLAYVREERAVIVRRARERDPDYQEPEQVFITLRGTKMSPRRIGAMFSDAAHKAEVDATFHSLRHTFAGVMLRTLQRQAIDHPEMNPLLALQTILGHADLATTAIYLRMVAIDLEAVELALDDLFDLTQPV
ncbi:recombinase XerD (plasmid) [Sphingomonas panacis]|uniref:Recombinase XerD n=1 Tax=Sphingomonas panacis TaxID=1560345 RepID=A0A1B3ZIQ0_9SPHN|nr:tyrosine-type recombinase/integrase [Sphingomonas panacis]AOH87303.1 recombinase XerD [Sphingomonas panacis]